MGREISIGSAVINVDAQERLIAEEWEARKPDAEAPGGYAPSVSFNVAVTQLRGLRSRLRDEIFDEIGYGSVTEDRIDDLKSLERLCFHAESDPRGARRRHGDREIDKGNSPYHAGPLESERFRHQLRGREQATERFQVTVDHTGR